MAHYPLNHPFRQTYRLLAAAAGLYLVLVGVLGIAFTWGDPFFHRGSDWVLALRVNPASSWLLLVLGLIVLAAAVLGGNVHHRVNMVAGWALLTVAMLQMMVLQVANVLNVSMVNVIVLVLCGLAVLTAALYGKVGDPEGSEGSARAAHASGG
jgi:uncharacterized protein DUF4383